VSISIKSEKAASKTHAERSAETRSKIVEAVVSCIAELGLKKTTTNAIAERAGVTWGALQHHFGGLDGCLIAAFDDSFGRFVKTVGEPPSPQEELQKRVAVFVERSWAHYSSAHYLSMFQLLLNDMFEMDDKQWQKSQQDIIHAMDDVWKRFFQDVIPDKDKRRMLARYTHSVLTGLAVSHSYQWGSSQMKDELILLRISILSQMKPA
jgi:AcrR family transcriptional regulator